MKAVSTTDTPLLSTLITSVTGANTTSKKGSNMSRKYRYERPVKVVLSCNGDYVNENEVEFSDIYEDIQGRDKVVFVCPVCGEKHTSYRLG